MNTVCTSQEIKQLLSSVNKAIAKIGIDVTATEISDTLRNMNRILNRVFFSLNIMRHDRILLTTMIDTNVKQYKTRSTTTLVVSADLIKLLLVLFARSSITLQAIFSNVASDKSEWNTYSFKHSRHKRDQTTVVYFKN